MTTTPQPGDRVRVSYETVVSDTGHFLGKGHVQRDNAENARVEIIQRHDAELEAALDSVARTITAARCHDAADAGGSAVANLVDETVRTTADIYRHALEVAQRSARQWEAEAGLRETNAQDARRRIEDHRARINTLGDAVKHYRQERDQARSWARHGYEIGQRSCTWSDEGVAPKWLTEGHNPAALVAPESETVEQRVSAVQTQVERAEQAIKKAAPVTEDRIQAAGTELRHRVQARYPDVEINWYDTANAVLHAGIVCPHPVEPAAPEQTDPWRIDEWNALPDICFINSCESTETDHRGPVFLRDNSIHKACPDHWEPIMAVLGAQTQAKQATTND